MKIGVPRSGFLRLVLVAFLSSTICHGQVPSTKSLPSKVQKSTSVALDSEHPKCHVRFAANEYFSFASVRNDGAHYTFRLVWGDNANTLKIEGPRLETSTGSLANILDPNFGVIENGKPQSTSHELLATFAELAKKAELIEEEVKKSRSKKLPQVLAEGIRHVGYENQTLRLVLGEDRMVQIEVQKEGQTLHSEAFTAKSLRFFAESWQTVLTKVIQNKETVAGGKKYLRFSIDE